MVKTRYMTLYFSTWIGHHYDALKVFVSKETQSLKLKYHNATSKQAQKIMVFKQLPSLLQLYLVITQEDKTSSVMK